MRPPTGNRITQGQHLASKAVDYSASPDPYVYAPENGRVDSYAYRGSGTNSAGNVLRIAGATGMHSLCHLERTYVSPGQTVTKGQKVAKMGYTGYTIPSGPAGTHLHYYVLTPTGYKYPPTLYTEPFNQGGNNVADKTNLSTARILGETILGRDRNATHAGKFDGDYNKYHVNVPLTNEYLFSLWQSGEAAANVNRVQAWERFYNTYKDKIAELSSRPTKAQLEELGKALQDEKAKVEEAEKALEEAKKTGGGISAEDSEAIKETNSIVKNILAFLTGIFKRGE